jgi:energy-coupling factor transporter transmembrane protein EcfT
VVRFGLDWREYLMRGVLIGIAASVVISLATQIITPFSVYWWLGQTLAVLVILATVLRAGKLMSSYFLIAGCTFSVLAALSFLGWFLLPPAPKQEHASGAFLYFDVDLGDASDVTSPRPGRIVNVEDEPFHNVTSWFSPSSAKREPNPPGGAYWSLRDLKFDLTPLHKGIFWTGKMIPPGDYCIEYNAIREGKSLGFVERLQLVEFDGKLVQLVDVWANGEERV